MNRTPVYDNDLVTKAYVDNLIKETDDKIVSSVKIDASNNFTTQPTPPYSVNDTWISNGVVYVCIQERLIGNFVANDWIKQIDTGKYDDFIDNTYEADKAEFESSLDSKIETFVTQTDPSTDWVSSLDKEKHVGDFWVRNPNETYVYVKFNENPVRYDWIEQSVVNKTIIDMVSQYKIKDTIMDWSYEFPTKQPGQIVLWRTEFTYKDGTKGYTIEAEITGDKGEDGVVQSEVAPEDTTRMWLDINTDELKRYVNGEWIVIAKNYSYIEEDLRNNYYDKTQADELLQTEHAYSVETRELSNGLQYRINDVETILSNGVSRVITTSVTVDNSGVSVGKSDSNINTTLAVDGVYIRNIQTTVAKFTANGSELVDADLKGKIQECGIIQKEEFIHEYFGKGLAHYYIGG